MMERVQGIGGFFFIAQDPEGLSEWYARHLGVMPPPPDHDEPVWAQRSGETVFAPFGQDHSGSPHLGPSGRGLNFRVLDLDAMVRQLRSSGIHVDVDPENYPNGRFARLTDPEGNPVQLWEPLPEVSGERGFVILINGASSAGKSTLARAVQDRFPEPLLKFGLDVFLDGDILPMRHVRDGRIAWETMRPSVMEGFHACLTALTEAGNNLIVDHIFESSTEFDRLTDAVRRSVTFIVGLHCDLQELERREITRGDRGSGDARTDVETVHQFCTYDLELHSDRATVDENADALIDAWNATRRAAQRHTGVT